MRKKCDLGAASATYSWFQTVTNPTTVYGNESIRTTFIQAKTSANAAINSGGEYFTAELFTANASCDTNLYTYSCMVSCSPYTSPHTASPSCTSSARIEVPSGPHWVDAQVTDRSDGTYKVVYRPEVYGYYDLYVRLANGESNLRLCTHRWHCIAYDHGLASSWRLARQVL